MVEDTESFSVNLMLVTQGLGQAVSIDPMKTSVLIIDQDGEVTALESSLRPVLFLFQWLQLDSNLTIGK